MARYPYQRPRRLRQLAGLRESIAEHQLRPSDFIAPLFLLEGTDTAEDIPSMPDVQRLSLDRAVNEARELHWLGIRHVLLFAKVPDAQKDNTGSEAVNPEGLLPRAVRAIKEEVPELSVMTDVALDPYSAQGHDGLVAGNGEILNDETLDVLSKMALVHAEAGADMLAPSDMMDGRVLAIRSTLEKEGYPNTGILSYTAKYASSFYGPFRDALGSAPSFGDKQTYQMAPANAREALREAALDEDEGADILMVKPGMPYLDVLHRLRAGADLITTYFARAAATALRDSR